jgi:hypothetical protein
VTSNDTIVELMKRHVLREGEQVVRVKNWPDGIALTTDLRHFVAGPEAPAWAISTQPGVQDVVIATRDDLLVEGQPEQFGFVLLADGNVVYLNDAAAVADLGTRLTDGLDPRAYAQILVAFHPYSSAYRAPLSEPDELRRVLGDDGLPEVEPLRLTDTADGVRLTFTSFVRYTRPGGAPQVDLLEWTVDAAPGQPARWKTRQTATGITLAPAAGPTGAPRLNWNTP